VTIDLEAEKTAVEEPPSSVETGAAEPSGVSADEVSGPAPGTEPPRETGEDRSAGGKETSEARQRAAGGRSIGSLAVAGLLGGLVALAGAWALDRSGMLAGGSNGASADAAIAEIRAEIGMLKDDLTDRIAETGTAVAGATTRLDTLAAQFAPFRTELEALKAMIAEGGAGDAPALLSLQERLDAFERRLADLAVASPGDDEAATRIAAIETALGAVRSAAEAALAATSGQASAIETLKGAIADLSGRLERQEQAPEVALAIAAAALKSAIDRGVPFLAELEIYAAIAPAAPEVEALRAIAATGVPTREEIAGEAPAAAIAIVEAANAPGADAGFFERIFASLKSLVRVRPIGMVEGDSAAAIAARIELAIRVGDYRKAIDEFEALGEPEKAAGEPFMAKVRARFEAERLVEKALADALRPRA
jgi:hypothetical protein